ncbi:hypothetical protein [Scleromatobacter humisilvae]|uniref:Uncharacterized protein n=1 Tax=Scleromatobacter humisilvae TaxID=2897159 RepID=A0A9X1YKA5_9BURK|nr:hypothetical protein [Scleromatobacter humisilvae]MCK9687267.1 hypothetical protein [Scleromatobacter humisilvae]
MPAAYATPPATVSKALDAIAAEVLAMAVGSPRPTHRHLANSIQRRFAIEVSPDNLRMWLTKRHAEAVRDTVVPGVSNPLDPHLELVNELRDPARNDGGVYTWVQILDAIKGIDPSLVDCKDTTLRSWYSRRARRAASAQAIATSATIGRDALAAHDASVGVVTPSASVSPTLTVEEPALPSPSAATPWSEPDIASTPAAGEDARAAAAAELAQLRGDTPSELESVLSRFLPQKASQ